MKQPVTLLFRMLTALLFLLPGALQAAPPTTPASNLVFSNISAGNMFAVWTNGDGTRRIIIASATGPVTSIPADGTDYNASTTFGNGDQLNAGEFVVYDGAGSFSWIYGLSPATTYYFAIFEYNGSGFTTEYLTASFETGIQATLGPPTTQASAVVISNVTGNSMQISWTNGDGNGRMVLMKEATPVDANPVDLAAYSATTSFGNGTQIGSGNYVVYRSSGNSVTVTNLQPGTTYHVAVFEYNGSGNSSAYLTPGAISNATTGTTPTQATTNLQGLFPQGNYFRVSWTNGNGARRIVVVRAGAPVTGIPVDGVDYTPNSTFGSGDQLNPGEYVVYDNSGTFSDIFGLQPSTTYHIAIFEYNGTGTSTFYSATAGTLTQNTLGPPSVQASAVSFSNVTGSSMQVSWTNGDGAGRIVVVKEGSAVDGDPVNLGIYSPSASFGLGTQIGTGNYVAYLSTGSSFTLTNLNPGQTYHVAVYEYNGTSGRVFLTPGAIGSQMTGGAPTVAASNLNFNFLQGNYMRVLWTSGNGSRRIVVARAGSPVTGTPTDGVDYTPSTTFGNGDAIAPGEFVIYDNSGTFMDLFSLSPATTYHFAVFEYNGTGTNTLYQTSGALTGSQATLSAPTTGASNVTFSNISGNSMQISWTNGDGDGRLVIMREVSAVNGSPVDLTNYSASTNFGLGSQIGTGNYVVYQATGSSVTVNNLNPGTTYHVEVFEYNGTSGRVYLTPGTAGSQATGGAPTVPATNLAYQFVTATSMRLSWTNGGGSRRVIVARAGSAVTGIPSNGTSYSASAIFGNGDVLAVGEFVVYDGTGTFFDLSGLTSNTVYHFAIFEYNGSGASILYQQTGFLTGSQSSASSPVTGASNLTFNSVTTTSMDIGWTNGSGSGRMVVATEAGVTLSANPIDGVNYSPSATFGSGTAIGNGFVVYEGTASSFSLSGLQNGTNYTFYVFEYNGNTTSSAYVTTPLSGTQLTLGAPSIQPSNPIFSSILTNAVTIDWTNGGGENRLVVIRLGASVTGTPIDGTAYTANSFFGSGDQLNPLEFVVYTGNASSVTITNLAPSTSYEIAIFEYNGSGAATLYNPINPATGSFTTDALPFPVEWGSVSAEWEGATARIRWTTLSEQQSESFELQKLNGNSDWETISEIRAAGTSQEEKQYSAVDVQPHPGDVYRILQIDQDGGMNISDQIELSISSSVQTLLYPNPAANQISLSSLPEGKKQLSVIDLSGQVVAKWSSNEFRTDLDVSLLPEGRYWLVILHDEGREAKAFTVLR